MVSVLGPEMEISLQSMFACGYPKPRMGALIDWLVLEGTTTRPGTADTQGRAPVRIVRYGEVQGGYTV